MPSTTILEIPPAEQVQRRAILRRARYGSLLAFHVLLLCGAGRTPTEIAACLFCSRSSVYRIVHAYRTGSLGIRIDQEGQCSIAVQSTICRCFRAVDRLPSHRGSDTPSGMRGAMSTQVLHCPYGDETDIVRHGTSPEGKQRYGCRQCLKRRGRTAPWIGVRTRRPVGVCGEENASTMARACDGS